ncbi:hydroxypyruvate isomerase family protein [Paracandidimonas lactea]|uniref:hydroxypyruvate isomerase family protein n=1 Tax=Paracandidimonas lactea TaxID=2895524 RepID=UPI001F44EB83|nr:TIM barrel protein [Paracandidimonas lactea]
MLKLSANISLLYPDLPFLQRVEAAAQSGFGAIEVMYPYEHNADDLAHALRKFGLTLSVLNAPPGDYAAGERGLAAIPGREQDFRDSITRAIDYANVTGCQNVHVLTGNIPAGAPSEAVRQTMLVNLIYAAERFAPHGIALLLEPLSSQVLPDYSLTRVEAASELLQAIRHAGCANVGLQVDLYHTQMEQGNLAALLRRYCDEIDYIQIAGVPGRHEPTVGEINYRYLLDLLASQGFEGWVGCEYTPREDTDTGLAWARSWGLLNSTGRKQ